MGGGEPPHDVRRSNDSKAGDADDAGSQIQKPMKGCKSQNARQGIGKAEDAKSQSREKPHKPAKSRKSQNEEELGMHRMRKAKAKKPPKAATTNKKPKSQEVEKPKSQEAEKPRSQKAKSEK